jgi:hypothetical protein
MNKLPSYIISAMNMGILRKIDQTRLSLTNLSLLLKTMMSSKELQTLEKCNKIKIEKIINIPSDAQQKK